jgi:cytochrome P450
VQAVQPGIIILAIILCTLVKSIKQPNMATSSLLNTVGHNVVDRLQSTSSSISAAACICSLMVLGILVYRVWFHPLAGIPGPFLARLTGLWRTYHYFRGTWHDDILALHNTYGRVVRIAPGELSVVDGDTLKRLYGHGKPAKKTPWYSTWEIPGASTAFFAQQDPKYHAFLRKRVSHVYSMTSIVAMEPYIQSCLDLMLQLLQKYADSGETVDMSEWTNAFAYDVVGEIAYGERFGHLESEKDVMGLRQAIFDRFYLMANMGHVWGQMFFFDNCVTGTLVKWLGLVNTSPYAKFQSWTNEKVTERREGRSGSSRKDMLNHFLNMKQMNGEPATHSEVMMEALNIV